jgi:hypothetical protein
MRVGRVSFFIFLIIDCLTFVRNNNADILSPVTLQIHSPEKWTICCKSEAGSGIFHALATVPANHAVSAYVPAQESVAANAPIMPDNAAGHRIYQCRAYYQFYTCAMKSSLMSYLDLTSPFDETMDVSSFDYNGVEIRSASFVKIREVFYRSAHAERAAFSISGLLEGALALFLFARFLTFIVEM